MPKTKAAVIHEKGEPDVFRWEEIELGAPGPGEVCLKNHAVGVNFVDTYHRRGTPHPWPVPPLPLVLGFEGAAEVQETGPGVKEFKPGDRVAYAMPPHGAYSQERNYPADMLCRIPDGIDDATIASSMLKGLTAQYLLRRTYRVQPGDFVLIHAAAGGMGHVLCPWAKHLGATVIGTVSTAEKAEIARGLGCDYTINYSENDFLPICRDITGGEGVHVVYESIGKDTFRRSMDCLRPLGMMASCGHASGAPDRVDVIELGARGSLFLTRPAIMHYMAQRTDMVAAAEDLFSVITVGAVKPAINHLYPLSEAAEAHRAIEERRTTGATVLLPFE